MVWGVFLVVRYQQDGAVCELPFLAASRIENVLGSQPVLSRGGGGAGTHFNSALVRPEGGGGRWGEIQIRKDFNFDRCGYIGGKITHKIKIKYTIKKIQI